MRKSFSSPWLVLAVLLVVVVANGCSDRDSVVGVGDSGKPAVAAIANVNDNAANGNDNGTNGNDNAANGNTNAANGNDNAANGNTNGANGNTNGGNGNDNGLCSNGSTLLRASMSGHRHNRVDFKARPGVSTDLRVRVRGFDANSSAAVLVDGTQVGTVMIDARGRGEFRVRGLPMMEVGTSVSVGSSTGILFENCPAGNGNTNSILN